jgi:hypothetical protein
MVRSWTMFGFHHFLDQMDGRFMDVAAIMGAIRVLRLMENHSGTGESSTGETLNSLMKSVKRGHGVRSQFGEEVEERRVGEVIAIFRTL